MVDDLGLGEWRFDIDNDSAVDMSKALLAIHTNLPEALEKVQKAMAFVKKRQQETMAIVAKTLNQ